MKDFLFWREAIYNSKTLIDLKSVGEDLAQFQKQSGLFGDEEKKLTDDQVVKLRKVYTEKIEKFEKETMPQAKPKFKK